MGIFLSLYFYAMISLNTHTSNPTKRTFEDDVIYMKGIEPFTVKNARLEITIKTPSLSNIHTSPK